MKLFEKILYEVFVETKVKSSNIDAIGYDSKQKLLRIIFKSGSTYEYSKVPVTIWNKLKTAKSKGSFAYYNICYKFPYQKIEE
jgi:hypothetical protein